MKHPIADDLLFPVKCPFPAMADREAWELPEDALRGQLNDLAAFWAKKPYPMLTAGEYLAYTKTGSRQAFEKPYFDRRRKLCASLIGACVSGDAAKLDDVIDGIWCICEETSWVISAHNEPGRFGKQSLPDDVTPRIDLFCAQTGMILALCAELCGKELDAVTLLIRDRIGRCLEERILIPFERTDDHWWMGVIRKDLNNWTPWIVSNVMLIACLRIREDKARLAALLERACVMLDRYLDIMPEDGGCDEGMGYWNLAGGMLLDCAELLENVTGGRMSFRNDRKFINILSYPRHAYLGGGWCVNFADCDARPEICGERIARAGEMTGTPELTAFGAAHGMTPMQYLNDTPQLWRLLNAVFHRLPARGEPEPESDTWLPDLQLRICRKNGITLVCKAGHNGENHNHNDVGSFMIYADGEPEIADAGNMIYTAKTFSAERYTLWNTRGMYHNIPMIGGTEQQPGTERRARNVHCLPDGMELDMALCYPEETGITECVRRLTAAEDGTVTVTDSIRTRTAQPVTWVFIARHEPEILSDAVCIGKLKMQTSHPFTADVEEIRVDDARMARSFPGMLWRLTLTETAACAHDAAFRFVRR
ncbi:MAG: heparinase II/III family protein [Clostridia bacterium]|nr:heparinase II/III family protein [Clostridia bacterium]